MRLTVDHAQISALGLRLGVQEVIRSLHNDPKLKLDQRTVFWEDAEPDCVRVQPAKRTQPPPGCPEASLLWHDLVALRASLLNVIVGGIPSVERAVINEKEGSGSAGGARAYKLLVEGTGLTHVMGVAGVDGRRTCSNHVIEVEKALGIEAARSTIMSEIQYTMGQHGMDIDSRRAATRRTGARRAGPRAARGLTRRRLRAPPRRTPPSPRQARDAAGGRDDLPRRGSRHHALRHRQDEDERAHVREPPLGHWRSPSQPRGCHGPAMPLTRLVPRSALCARAPPAPPFWSQARLLREDDRPPLRRGGARAARRDQRRERVHHHGHPDPARHRALQAAAALPEATRTAALGAHADAQLARSGRPRGLARRCAGGDGRAGELAAAHAVDCIMSVRCTRC